MLTGLQEKAWETSRSVAVAAVAGLWVALAVLGSAPVAAQRSLETIRGAAGSAEEQIRRGSLLVASRQLVDPNFLETVVLILDYGEGGAMGLVINRSSDVALERLLPQIEGLEEVPNTVYVGGPVALSQMLFLVRAQLPPAASEEILEGVHLSGSSELLQELVGARPSDDSLRVYAGHAGWAPGQLEFEVAVGSWQVMAGTADLVFDTRPEEIWRELIVRSNVKWAHRMPGGGLVGVSP